LTNVDGSTTDFVPQSYIDAAVAGVTRETPVAPEVTEVDLVLTDDSYEEVHRSSLGSIAAKTPSKFRSFLPTGQETARVSSFHRLWSRCAPSNGPVLLFECVGVIGDIFFPQPLHHSMYFVWPVIVTIL
jgi:hypothetical protein